MKESINASSLTNKQYAEAFFNEDDVKLFTDEQLDVIGDSIRHTLINCLFDYTLENSEQIINILD